MLSGLEIKRQVELGNIVISDFDEKRLNPNSYNIRLGKTLKVYEKGITPGEEIQKRIDKEMEPVRDEYIKILETFKDEDSLTEDAQNERDNKINDIIYKSEEIRNRVLREYALDPRKDNVWTKTMRHTGR